MYSINYKCGSYDLSEYPIIRAKINPTTPSLGDIKDYLNALMRIVGQKSGPFVLLIDASESPWLSKEKRETTFIGIKCIQQEYKDRYKAQYIISKRLPVRLLISLINGFSKKSIPQKIFSNEEAAISEIKKDMEEW